ncbi:hypothetical protein D3C87_2132960 [compost metagenome]
MRFCSSTWSSSSAIRQTPNDEVAMIARLSCSLSYTCCERRYAGSSSLCLNSVSRPHSALSTTRVAKP